VVNKLKSNERKIEEVNQYQQVFSCAGKFGLGIIIALDWLLAPRLWPYLAKPHLIKKGKNKGLSMLFL
jgi:hypothetical protein